MISRGPLIDANISGVRLVAESFAWPFRGAWRQAWAVGLLTVLFLPLLFIPLLGYAVAATRASEIDPATGPPRWRFSIRLLVDGFWVAVALFITVLPFALLLNPLAQLLTGLMRTSLNAQVLAFFLLALPSGLLALLVLPHSTAAFAASGKPSDLFNFAGAVRGLAGDFATWNAVVAAMVTAWAIGLACVGLLCVGIVPGVFYAILVSAHAAAALHHQGSHQGPASG